MLLDEKATIVDTPNPRPLGKVVGDYELQYQEQEWSGVGEQRDAVAEAKVE